MQRKRLKTSQESRRQVRADGATRLLRLEAVGEEPDGPARYSGDALHCCMYTGCYREAKLRPNGAGLFLIRRRAAPPAMSTKGEQLQ